MNDKEYVPQRSQLEDANFDLYCAYQRISDLEQQLQQAHRDATEEVAKAHKRGWEQCKREAGRIGVMCKSEDDCISDGLNFGSYERGVMDAINAIAAMEYSHKEG